LKIIINANGCQTISNADKFVIIVCVHVIFGGLYEECTQYMDNI